jgi:hypothetical protein
MGFVRRTNAEHIEAFATQQTGTNEYYVYSFSTPEEGREAEKLFRAAFDEAHGDGALPRSPGNWSAAFNGNSPLLGTAFRNDRKVLLVRTPNELEADGLVFKHLGKPDYRATL